eukprot:scaffold66783_cov70-Cyclotella_meneghiniana.AAC.1
MNHRPPTPDPYSQLDDDDTLSLPLTTMNDDISINNNNNSDDDSNSTLPPLDDSNEATARALRARAVRGAMIGMQQSGGNNNPLRSRRILFANYDDEGNDADNTNNDDYDDGDDGGDVPAANWMSAIDAVNNNNTTAATADGNTVNDALVNNNNNNTATTTQRRTITTRQDLRIPMHLWERMFDTFRNTTNNNNDNMDMLFNLTQPNNIEFRKRDTLCCPLCMVRYEMVGGSVVLKVATRVDTDGGDGGNNGNGDENNNAGSENNNAGNTNANINNNEDNGSFVEVIPGPEPLESPSQSNASSSYSSMPSLEPYQLNNRPSSAGNTPHSSMPSLEHNPNNGPSSLAGITPPLSPLPPLVDPEEEGRSLESLEPQIDSTTIQNLANASMVLEHPHEHINDEELAIMNFLERQRDSQQREVPEWMRGRIDEMERNILERQRDAQRQHEVQIEMMIGSGQHVIARHFEEAARRVDVLPARRERDDDDEETASVNETPVSANNEGEAAEEGHRDIDHLDEVVLDTLEATEQLEVAPQRPQSREEMRRNRVIAQLRELREEARARRERYEEEETASRNEAPVSASDEAEAPDDAS